MWISRLEHFFQKYVVNNDFHYRVILEVRIQHQKVGFPVFSELLNFTFYAQLLTKKAL